MFSFIFNVMLQIVCILQGFGHMYEYGESPYWVRFGTESCFLVWFFQHFCIWAYTCERILFFGPRMGAFRLYVFCKTSRTYPSTDEVRTGCGLGAAHLFF